MRCDYCDLEMNERAADEVNPYAYALAGLSDVELIGIKIHQCPRCAFTAPIIPRVAALHRLIARVLTQKRGLLSGEEIRFLRKHAGLPATKFARLLGISPEHLSRVENGHTDRLGRTTDRLVRAFTLVAKDGEEARQLLLEVADTLARGERKTDRPSVFVLERKGWKLAA